MVHAPYTRGLHELDWLAACEYIEGLDVDTIVPGHGPPTDKEGPRQVRGYAEWSAPERIVVNVDSVYAELDPETNAPHQRCY